MRRLVASAVAAGCLAGTASAAPDFSLVGAKIQDKIDAMIAVLGFQVIPDVTTTSLGIQDPVSGNPNLLLSQLGAGFTWSDSFPLYLEGMLAYSRYDPLFVASDGTQTRDVPLKWNSVAITAGLGWDIRLSDTLVLRPMINGTIGYLGSDLSAASFVIGDLLDKELSFARRGDIKAWGGGGSLVLDYDYDTADNEYDFEIRYSYMHLQTFDGIAELTGNADVGSLNVWARWRAPLSDWSAFGNPVRHVLELTYSEFTGDQRGALGFDRLVSLGAGVELDLSRSEVVDRARAMLRYVRGDNVSGFSLGFAVTF
jgi:hypothetical protein